MNFLKRAFLCIMAVIVLAALVSCRDNDTEEPTDTQSQESVTTSATDNSDGDYEPVEDDDDDDSEDTKPSGGATAADTGIRLGDDNKNWGSYNPYE